MGQIEQFNRLLRIIIFLFWEFFTPAIADGFSLDSEWQQVSSFPGLFSVFWPISTMLYFGWSLFIINIILLPASFHTSVSWWSLADTTFFDNIAENFKDFKDIY